MTRLNRTRAILGVIAAAAMAGCASEELLTSRNLTHSVATNACGLADAPGIVIMLANHPVSVEEPPDGEYVRAFVAGTIATLAGKTVAVSGNFEDAMVTLYTSPTKSTFATGGTVHISSISPDRVVGSVDLIFPDRRLTAPFDALLVARAIMCG